MLNRPAQRRAVIAVLERPFRRARQRLEEIACVQLVIAKKLVDRSVRRVSPGFDDGVDNGSRVTSIFGRTLGLDAELGQRVDGEESRLRAVHAALVEGRLVAE